MNKSEHIADLLSKYLNNTCTKEEFDELFELIDANPEHKGLDEALAHYWNKVKDEPTPHDVNWVGIYNAVKNKKPIRNWKTTSLKYAACVALIALVYSITLFRKADINRAPVYITVQSPVAKTKVVVLADGSTVTLNANSKLRYPQNFNGNLRNVYLTGEAYFQVVHNDQKPFIVYSGKLKTQVLGTTFTVKAYSPSKLSVTVLTGKVGVLDNLSHARAMLTRGQSAEEPATGNIFKLTQLKDPEDAIAWIEDKLMFDNSNLTDVTDALTNKYGVQIKITSDRVAKQRITAIFQRQTLPDILRGITRLTHSKYTYSNNTYTLY